MSKYNPDNVKWVDFLLASYCGNEQKLWESINRKYEMPPEPKEPTWGKGIRKERWAKYEDEKIEYEKKAAIVKKEFKKECEYWDGRLAAYIQENQGATGRNLLQRALSGSGNVIAIVTTPAAPSTQVFQAKVPEGMRAGDQFTASAGGSYVTVKVPPGAPPGTLIQFSVPATAATTPPVPVAQAYSTSAPLPVATTYTAPTATAYSAPNTTTSATTTTTSSTSRPPLYQAPTKQSSFKVSNSGIDGGWAPAESDLYASASTSTYDAPPPAIGSSSLSSPPPAIGAPAPSKYN